MPVNLVSTACLGNLNDPSYELLLRRELGGVFEVDELLLDWDQADARTFVGVTELGRTVDIRLGAADGDRLADGDVLAIDRSGMVPVAVVVRLRSAEVYLVEVDRMDRLRSRMRAGRSATCMRRSSEATRTSIPCACIRRCSLFWAACSGVSRVFGSQWSRASSMPAGALRRVRRRSS
ncbi:MAG: hypothetical protein ACLU37_05100 [Collinsella sp.]